MNGETKIQNFEAEELDCIETPEDVAMALAEVEQKLARQLRIRPGTSVRRELVALVRSGVARDELLDEWLELYTTHMHWVKRSDSHAAEPPARRMSTETTERAAEAALLLL